MKVVVLGAGLMGSAVVYDLARSKRVQHILVADVDLQRAETVAKREGNAKTSASSVDVRNPDEAVKLMRGCDVVISAVTLYHNEALAKAAIEAGTNFCDLGGSDDIVAKQKELHDDAVRAGVTIIPNCGLAPGMANVIAMHGAKLFDEVSELQIRVGGLPQHPRPPLNYQLVFGVDGLINEYSGKVKVLRNSRIELLDPLTELESIEFPPPFGHLEAFLTSGGASLLPDMLQGKVKTLDYKTIRYPGHAEKMKTLLEIGFASTEPIDLGGLKIRPRDLFAELLKKKVSFGGKDVVLMRIVVRGVRQGKESTLTYTMIDRYDESSSLTAMMRTTAFPTSIIAQMIASGAISMKGVYTPEECVPAEPFMKELRLRNIVLEEFWS